VDIYSEYTPHTWQVEMHADPNRHIALCGGKGTLDLDSLLYDADLESYVSIRWLLEHRRRPCVLSWTNGGWKKIWASTPYFEGIGPMYRVELDSGKTICVSGYHRFLTQRGFVQTLDLLKSDSVFGPKNLPSKLQSDVAYAPSESQIALDLTDDYWKGLGQYDGRLLNQSEVCQEFFPLSFERLCQQDREPFGKQPISLRQRLDSTPLAGILSESGSLRFFYYEASDEVVREKRATEVLYKCDSNSSQAWRDVLSTQSMDLEPTAVSFDEADNALWEYRGLPCDRSSSESHTLDDETRSERSRACSKDQLTEVCSDFLYSYDSPNEVDSTSTYDGVKSVEYIGDRAYFDLHVPGAHNYVAEGMVHHNSGKTKSAIEDLLSLAIEYPGTKWIIGRQTYQSLKDSTWDDFYNAIPESLIKSYNKTEMIITLITGSKFFGRALENPKKFESMVISGFLLDEADEIKEDVFKVLKTRIRQQIIVEGRKVTPPYRSIVSFNPPDEDHWLIVTFVDEKLPNHSIYFCSTLNNMDNLPEGYVEELQATYSEDMQQRIIHGLPGRVHKGRPVYPQFKSGNYINPIEVDPKAPIFRCWDFGYNRPAIIWAQYIDGQARILAELLGKQIYLEDFIKNGNNRSGKEQPFVYQMQEELFPGHLPGYKDFCDPRGADESDKGMTSIQILNDHGIYPIHRRTSIKEGLKVVREHLDQKTTNGEPRFQIHSRCKNAIEGLRGGYHRLDGEDDPVKDNYFDHIQDIIRYLLIHLGMRYKSNALYANLNQNVYIHPTTGRRIEG